MMPATAATARLSMPRCDAAPVAVGSGETVDALQVVDAAVGRAVEPHADELLFFVAHACEVHVELHAVGVTRSSSMVVVKVAEAPCRRPAAARADALQLLMRMVGFNVECGSPGNRSGARRPAGWSGLECGMDDCDDCLLTRRIDMLRSLQKGVAC